MMTTHAISASSLKPYRFRSSRAFKAFDDGSRQKWVLVVSARDLPRDLPLDANARVPNVIKNPTCGEMRETLLTRPELFQILNGGVVCTATSVGVKQEGNEQWVDVAFDQDQLQGVVNGGHTYGTLLHTVHDHPIYAEGMSLKAVLAKKDRAADNPDLAPLLENDERLAERIARARERTMVQLELVAPISDPELLHDIARARNLSQSVDQTALQNLAGKYELMKEVLRDAPPPFGPSFVERVVWKTNQEVPEGSAEVPVKTLIHLLALMNTRMYKPGVKVANEVYVRSGVIVREFGEAEGEDSVFYDKLAQMLPEFIRLYDRIYSALPETQPSFPWADGKPPTADRKRRKTAFITPLLARACSTKVSGAFIWPVFSAFRLLLENDGGDRLRFKADPVALFEEKKAELSATIQNTFENQGRVVQQVGKVTDAWIRLESQIQMEMLIRERIKTS
jgi:AIPR protein